MDMELLRYYPTSKMQQATLLALWMTLAAHLMRTKTCTGKVNETSDFINNPICIMRVSHSKKHQKCEVAVVKEGKKRNVFLYFHAS